MWMLARIDANDALAALVHGRAFYDFPFCSSRVVVQWGGEDHVEIDVYTGIGRKQTANPDYFWKNSIQTPCVNSGGMRMLCPNGPAYGANCRFVLFIPLARSETVVGGWTVYESMP